MPVFTHNLALMISSNIKFKGLQAYPPSLAEVMDCNGTVKTDVA